MISSVLRRPLVSKMKILEKRKKILLRATLELIHSIHALKFHLPQFSRGHWQERTQTAAILMAINVMFFISVFLFSSSIAMEAQKLG